MDGLSVLSVAASVAQFIQFGCSLVSKSRQIYQSANGLPVQQIEAALAAKRLTELSERVKISRQVESRGSRGVSTDDQALEAICEGCISVSKELLSKLNKLKVEGGQKYRKFKSFRQALKSVWSKEAVNEAAQRLKAFQTELDVHLLVSLSEKFNSLTMLHDNTFASLDQQVRRSIKTVLPYLVDIHQKMKELMDLQRTVLDLHQREAFINKYKDELAEAARKREELYQNADTLVLRELWFTEISHRHLEIEEAHKQTFAWILEQNVADRLCAKPGGEGRMWDNFVKWLRESGSLYWINGKAGSGKSTLMRYLCDSAMTRQYLDSWAGTSKLQIISFYFWNSGSAEQRSQTGLLRSLLYQLLRGRKEIIKIVLEEEWDFFAFGHTGNLPGRRWSFPKLEKAFYEAVRLIAQETKISIFIDGLDEFEGDPEALVLLLTRISEFLNVKVCVSSRPWIIFEEHFGAYPGLRLQDLTYGDIRTYVQDKTKGNSKIRQLTILQPVQASSLTHNIVTKANGVFLWVKLVVWSLLDGLRNRDDIPELQKRLDILPSDLDALYQHILQRIDPLYFAQACRIFQIFNAVSDLQIQTSILELDLAVTATYAEAMKPPEGSISDQEILQRCDRMSAHLQTRCGGLLEVHDRRDSHWEGVEQLRCDYSLAAPQLPNNKDGLQLKHIRRVQADLKVAYLHRTVRDFLAVDSVRELLLKHIGSPAQFEPHISLLMGYTLNLKSDICSLHCTAPASHEQLTWMIVNEALLIARKANCPSMQVRDSILNEFSGMALRFANFPLSGKFASTSWTSKEWDAAFVSATAKFGLTSFVEHILIKDSTMSQRTGGTSLLAQVLGYPIDLKLSDRRSSNPIRDAWQPPSPSTVDLLLRYGANPNEIINKTRGVSLWQLALYSTYIALNFSESMESRQEDAWAEIVKIMLEHGVDPNTRCRHDHYLGLVDGLNRKFEKSESHIFALAHEYALLPLINDQRVRKGLEPIRCENENISTTDTGRLNGPHLVRPTSTKRQRSISPGHSIWSSKHAGCAETRDLCHFKRSRPS